MTNLPRGLQQHTITEVTLNLREIYTIVFDILFLLFLRTIVVHALLYDTKLEKQAKVSKWLVQELEMFFWIFARNSK